MVLKRHTQNLNDGNSEILSFSDESNEFRLPVLRFSSEKSEVFSVLDMNMLFDCYNTRALMSFEAYFSCTFSGSVFGPENQSPLRKH